MARQGAGMGRSHAWSKGWGRVGRWHVHRGVLPVRRMRREWPTRASSGDWHSPCQIPCGEGVSTGTEQSVAANRDGEPLRAPSGTRDVRMHHGGAIWIAFPFPGLGVMDSEWGLGKRGEVSETGAGAGTLLCRASEASEIALTAPPPLPNCSTLGARMICARHSRGVASGDPEPDEKRRK